MFKGSYVALVTPFDKNGNVDVKKIEELVEFHINNGTSGIVPCGTTGETSTLTEEEYRLVIKTVVDKVNKRIQVIAGAGSNNTKKAIELTNICKELGADAVLSTCPYYNKPTQRGIKEHYKLIAKTTNMPIVIYNIPGRTGVNILPETIYELSKLDEIVAIKEATGSIDQMIQIKGLCKDNIDILSGEDGLLLPMLAIGCKGVISVTANILPKEVSKLIDLYFNNKNEEAMELHQELYNISTNLFIEGNPVTIKTAMKIKGLLENDDVRLPLVNSSKETVTFLNKVLQKND